MITNLAFTVPGEPVGKGRARVGRVGGHARLYTPAKTVAYEGLVAHAGHLAMASAAPFTGPLAVEIEAVHPVPASWSKKRRQQALDGLVRPTVTPDWDNIGKAISDGGNGVVWADDRQIVDGRVIRRYGDTPAVHVRVAVLPFT